MTAPTHLIIFFTVANFLGMPLNVQNVIFGILGTLIPDISNPYSFIGKLFKNISFYIEQKFGHRTVTHSYMIIAVFLPPCLIAYYVLDDMSPLMFCFALCIHIMADMINLSGVQFLYPEKLTFVMPRDTHIRIETGSIREKRFAFVFILLFVLSLPFGIYGYDSVIRAIAGSHTAAVEEYKTSIDKNEVFVLVQNGLNRVTQEPVNGKSFKVVAVMPKKILLCEDENGNRVTVGQGEEAIIDSKKIKIKKGVPVHTTYTQLEASQGWEKIIEELQYPYTYIIGEITLSEKPHYTNTPGIWDGIKINENTVILNYADLKTIAKLTKYNISDGIVTIKKEHSTEGIISPITENQEESSKFGAFLINAQRESIIISIGQSIKAGDPVAISPETERYREEILGLRQKIFTVDAEESKASALQDKSLDIRRKIEQLDRNILVQKNITEKTSQSFFKEAEKNRLKNLEAEKESLQKETEEIKRSLKEEKEYIGKRKESMKREINAQIKAIEARITSSNKTSPYAGKIEEIKQKSANVFEIKVLFTKSNLKTKQLD